MSEGQRSRSRCQKHQITLSVIVTDIPIKPQQFLRCTLPLVRCRDLDLEYVTLKLNHELDILKMYLHPENEVAR